MYTKSAQRKYSREIVTKSAMTSRGFGTSAATANESNNAITKKTPRIIPLTSDISTSRSRLSRANSHTVGVSFLFSEIAKMGASDKYQFSVAHAITIRIK